MSKYEQQNLDTARHYDQMMKEIESIDLNILYSVVPGSRLHDIINNPVAKGVEKGELMTGLSKNRG